MQFTMLQFEMVLFKNTKRSLKIILTPLSLIPYHNIVVRDIINKLFYNLCAWFVFLDFLSRKRLVGSTHIQLSLYPIPNPNPLSHQLHLSISTIWQTLSFQ